MSDVDILTHSRLACFRACPRKHFLRYELGLVRDEDGDAVRVGKAFHAAVEAASKGLDVETAVGDEVPDPYDRARVAAMFVGHEARWSSSPLEHIAAELPFDLPFVNPETNRPTPNYRLNGKIDRIVRLEDGRLALMEYKTTSRDFSPGADYWTKLHFDLQLSIYVIAARALGYDLSTILYDVTRNPALRPLKATPMEARKYTKGGALYATQRDADESPADFAARISESIASDPDKHFARIEIARLDQDIDDARWEIWQQKDALHAAKKAGRWYRNPEACTNGYGSSCDFLPICHRRDLHKETPAGFRRVDNVHPELAENATTGATPS